MNGEHRIKLFKMEHYLKKSLHQFIFFYGHSLKFVENCIIEISQALCYKILKFKVFKYFIQL